MPKIPEDIVRRIEDTAKIEEVVGDFVKLRKTGVRYTGICPFHDDQHDGNFIVYPKENCYRCFTCDAKGGAVQFLMNKERMSFPDAIRWLGRKYCIETDNVPFDYVPPPLPPPPPPLPTLVLPRQMVAKRVGNLQGDNLYRWITTGIQWDSAQRARIEKVMHDYCVGHVTMPDRFTPDARHEFTVFWQIDAQGQPRTAHYMKYKPTGKRMHREDDKYNTDWLHSLLDRNGVTTIYNPATHEARQCLFGEHLLRRYPMAPVCIVESEKTALLMAIAYGNNPLQVWVACCGASNLTRERLKPLIDQGRRIILYPDRDGIADWKRRGHELGIGDRLSVDTKMVTREWLPQDGPKADIADVVVRMLNSYSGHPFATVGQLMDAIPQLRPLIERYNLELINDEQV